MNLLTVVNALNEARDDADAGLLELVLELRGDMLVYGYKSSETINTKIRSISELQQLKICLVRMFYMDCTIMIVDMKKLYGA